MYYFLHYVDEKTGLETLNDLSKVTRLLVSIARLSGPVISHMKYCISNLRLEYADHESKEIINQHCADATQKN